MTHYRQILDMVQQGGVEEMERNGVTFNARIEAVLDDRFVAEFGVDHAAHMELGWPYPFDWGLLDHGCAAVAEQLSSALRIPVKPHHLRCEMAGIDVEYPEGWAEGVARDITLEVWRRLGEEFIERATTADGRRGHLEDMTEALRAAVTEAIPEISRIMEKAKADATIRV